MSVSPPNPTLLPRRLRFFAAGAALIVLLLGLFAVSPQLHHWLHQDNVADHDDGCAVVLFASGVALTLDLIAVTTPFAGWQRVAFWDAAELFLVPARYLRQPERGPPVS